MFRILNDKDGWMTCKMYHEMKITYPIFSILLGLLYRLFCWNDMNDNIYPVDINILETIKPSIDVSGFEISRSNFDAKWYALAIKVVFTLLSVEPRHPKLQEYQMR